MVGDPPNIIIGARTGLSFNAFLVHMAPIVVIALFVCVAVSPLLFRGLSTVDAERIADVMSPDEGEAIRDRGLLIKSGVVLAVMLAGFVVSPAIHIQPYLMALLGAGIATVRSP